MQFHTARWHGKIFFINFSKIYENLMKNNVTKIEISKEPNKTREPAVTFSYIWQTHLKHLWKFDEE